METTKSGQSYWIDDADLIEKLKRGHKVGHIGGNWYTVTPAFSDDITWLDGHSPVKKYGSALVNLCSTTGVYMRLDFYKALNKTGSQVQCIETMRKDTWEVLQCFGIGSDMYIRLMSHFHVMTEMIQDRGYKPENLSQNFSTCDIKVDRLVAAKFYPVDECEAATGIKDVREAFERTFSPDVDAAFAQHAMYQMQNVIERMRDIEHVKRLTKNDDKPRDYRPQRPQPAPDPAQELLDKAKRYSNEGDPETAAHNLITVYNNLRYQELWGAANTVKAQIVELGYEVVDGFDDSDPAQVVKKI